MYGKAIEYYDLIYRAAGKDYEAEAQTVNRLVGLNKLSVGRSLLDVACGTGLHLEQFERDFSVEGLDLNQGMLDIARRRCPQIPLHIGDMSRFGLGRRFDIVTCLFSAIGHVRTQENLRRTIGNLAQHTRPGGVVLVEPWLHPGDYQTGRPWMDVVDEPEIKIARLNVSRRKGNVAVLHFNYLVATSAGVEHFTEIFELGMFTHEEYMEAFRLAGLETHHDPEGPMGRGIYIGCVPEAS